MNKYLKTILLISLIGIGLIFFSKPIFKSYKNTDTLINKIGCRLFEFNSISLKTENGLDAKNVELKIGNRIIFSDEKQQDKIGQFYGHVILKIYYDKLLVSEIGHWKRNNWYTNDYHITLIKSDHHYLVDYDISGPDGKNDNFQKRYVYTSGGKLIRIDYQNENGEVYNSEKRW